MAGPAIIDTDIEKLIKKKGTRMSDNGKIRKDSTETNLFLASETVKDIGGMLDGISRQWYEDMNVSDFIDANDFWKDEGIDYDGTVEIVNLIGRARTEWREVEDHMEAYGDILSELSIKIAELRTRRS